MGFMGSFVSTFTLASLVIAATPAFAAKTKTAATKQPASVTAALPTSTAATTDTSTPAQDVAAAPVATSKKSGAEQLAELKGLVTGRLRVGLSLNTSSKISGINLKSQGQNAGTAEANTENTPGVELLWVKRLYEGPGATKFDWFVGMTVERERQLSSLTIKAKNNPNTQNVVVGTNERPSFHANLLNAGLRWTPTERFYVPVGVNYGFLSQATWGGNGSFDLDPTLGLVVGAGFRLTPQLEFEATYKMIRYALTLRPADFATTGTSLDGSVDMSGVSVGGRYVF